MTHKEAIFHIQKHNDAHSRKERFAIRITEALKLAVEALEKQVPQKPFCDSLADRSCPVCYAYISFDALNDDVADAPKFCRHCGQALDWEDVE